MTRIGDLSETLSTFRAHARSQSAPTCCLPPSPSTKRCQSASDIGKHHAGTGSCAAQLPTSFASKPCAGRWRQAPPPSSTFLPCLVLNAPSTRCSNDVEEARRGNPAAAHHARTISSTRTRLHCMRLPSARIGRLASKKAHTELLGRLEQRARLGTRRRVNVLVRTSVRAHAVANGWDPI